MRVNVHRFNRSISHRMPVTLFQEGELHIRFIEGGMVWWHARVTHYPSRHIDGLEMDS